MKITAPDFDRLVQNVLLYADKKAVRLQQVLFVFGNNKVDAFSCDDYIAVTDSISPETEGTYEFSLSIEDTEKLGEFIKKDKKVIHKSDITVKFFNTYLKVYDEDNEEKYDFIEPAWPSWDLVMQLISEENDLQEVFDFAVRPERLVKLARLKAAKEAPIHLRGIDINGNLVVQFKKGLTVHGAIMPVDVSRVNEEFLWSHKDHTEV